MAVCWFPQADLARELDEGVPYSTGGQTRALLGDEKAGTAGDWELMITPLYIPLKRLLGRGMQRKPARFTELGVADR